MSSISKLKTIFNYPLVKILIGALYPLGFSPIDIWQATLLSLGLLVYLIIDTYHFNRNLHIPEERTLVKKAIISTCFFWGVGAYGVGTSWVYVSIHEFGNAALPLAVLITALFVLVLTMVKVGFGYLIHQLVSLCGKSFLILIIPFAWVVSEFVLSTLFNGFPWLLAGYSQMDGPLVSLATWFGVYGVGWFMLAIISVSIVLGECLFALYKINQSVDPSHQSALKSIRNKSFMILLIIMSFPLSSYLMQPEEIIPQEKVSLDVALVQPNISQDKKWKREYFSEIIDTLYLQTNEHWDADLIVWPEGAIPAYKHQVYDVFADIERKLKPSQSNLLAGVPIYDRDKNVSYVGFSAVGNSNLTYHKQALVPFGEYVPLAQMLRGVIDFFDLPMSNFIPGSSQQPAMSFEHYDVIPAICYEIAYPNLLQTMLKQADEKSNKPKLIVTVSNDAWFGDSLGPFQHMQMARMRALELGIPLIRSTNDGITAVVDAKGRQLAQLERHTQGTLRYRVSLDGFNTLYRQYGFLGLYLILSLSCLFFVVASVIRLRSKPLK
ncbi:MAG: apolipoprotein N-acyltransferase [Kangiella sp.]|nr:MAG: apolipoprotein N-acyltransferase [Kangiella sp.]